MDLSQVSNTSGSSNAFSLQSSLLNQTTSKKTNSNNSAYYAKKGEPMYMKEMDADEDGVVSFDEFKEYCQANGISNDEMVRMSTLASSYRTMKAQEKAEKNVQQKINGNKAEVKEAESDAVYAKRGDGKYDEVMDTNNDDKVTYKEYMEYCQEHAQQPQAQKADTKVQETDNGEFKTTSESKAISSYTQSESSNAEGMIDDEV